MKLYTRILACLMALAMLVSLGACKSGDDGNSSVLSVSEEESSESAELSESSESSESSEESEEDPAALAITDYENSVKDFEAADKLGVTVRLRRRVKFGPDETSISQTATAVYFDMQSDAPLAEIKTSTAYEVIRTVLLDEYEMYDGNGVYYFFDDFMVYDDEPDTYFYEDKSFEDFRAAKVPFGAIDPALYAEKTMSEDGRLVFSAPTGIESWVAPEYATPEEVQAKVHFDGEGKVKKIIYNATYNRGSVCYKDEFTIDYTVPEDSKRPVAPDVKEHTVEKVGDLEVLSFSLHGLYRAQTLTHFNIESSDLAISQAGGAVCEYRYDSKGWGEKDDNYVAKASSDIICLYYDGSSEVTTIEEEYENGVLNTTINGKTEVGFSSSKLVIDNLYLRSNISIPRFAHLKDIEVSDLGSHYYVEYTLYNSAGEDYKDYVCDGLFSDESYLDKKADNYTTQSVGGYFTVDKDTGMMNSMSTSFLGSHTIEGYPFVISLVSHASISVADPTTYESITGELPEEGFAEPEEKPTPLFYEVTSPDGGKMYMLGTIHIGDNATAHLPKEIYDALDGADALAVEMDTLAFEERLEKDEKFAGKISESYYYEDGSTIVNHIDEKLYDRAIKVMTAAGISQTLSERLNAATWSSLIDEICTDFCTDYSSEYGVDIRLIRYAKEKGVKVIDVEDPVAHATLFNNLSDITQEYMLAGSVEYDRILYNAQTKELYEMWCKGDEAALREHVKESLVLGEDASEEEIAAWEEYCKALSTDRDALMLEKAKEYMADGETVFFAVGLAHVLGETGLLDALRAEGYTVTQIEYGE
ncbi:MAG: TraB/GumN family protein [Clostridia bacterium]|nr:TraB/GumN family protein [Clostridia bacterium]